MKNLYVPEASTRAENYNVVEGADHFTICKPRDKNVRNFIKLKDFVSDIVIPAQVRLFGVVFIVSKAHMQLALE
jgi:hypothetical protein